MRWFLRALLVLAALAAAWLGIVWSGVLPPISAEQRAALAILRETPPPPPGRNAYALLHAQPWAVPAGQEEALLDEDLGRFAAWERLWSEHHRNHTEGDGAESPAAFASIAAERHGYRKRLPNGKEWLCDTEWDADCLGAVAKNPDAARAAIDATSDLPALAERLAQADHLRNPFPATLAAPLPGYGDWALVALNAAALRAHDGDVPGALADLCRFGLTWRRLRTGTDMLVSDMVGVAWVTVAVQQAMAIDSTFPNAAAWPAACYSLLQPLSTPELDQCNTARSEFANVERSLRLFDDPGALGSSLVPESIEHSLALISGAYHAICPAIAPGDPGGCGFVDWMFNPQGCRLMAPMAKSPSLYASYAERLRDLDRRLALARAARWWRVQPGASNGEPPAWPDEFAAVRDEIVVDTEARTLTLPMRDTSNPKRRVFRVRY